DVVARADDAVGGVVLRDRPAHDHARAPSKPRETLVENLSADVVEEHVDVIGRLLAQLPAEITALVVHRGVEAEVLDEHPALLGTPGDAHRAGAFDLGDLSCDGPAFIQPRMAGSIEMWVTSTTNSFSAGSGTALVTSSRSDSLTSPTGRAARRNCRLSVIARRTSRRGARRRSGAPRGRPPSRR